MNGVSCGLCDLDGIEDWNVHKESEEHKRRAGAKMNTHVRVLDTLGGRKEDPVAPYSRWWLGKRVRTSPAHEFKLVTNVEWIGNPSGVYGIVNLTYADGTEELVSGGSFGFKPRKYEMEVQEPYRCAVCGVDVEEINGKWRHKFSTGDNRRHRIVLEAVPS